MGLYNESCLIVQGRKKLIKLPFYYDQGSFPFLPLYLFKNGRSALSEKIGRVFLQCEVRYFQREPVLLFQQGKDIQ
jgi:hypothetical protein